MRSMIMIDVSAGRALRIMGKTLAVTALVVLGVTVACGWVAGLAAGALAVLLLATVGRWLLHLLRGDT